MRSSSTSRIFALLLVLGAPVVAPASLMSPVYAADESLSTELQEALQQAQQNQNNGSSFSGFDNYPVGGQFLLWQNNQAYALNVRTELDMQAAFLFTQLQNPSQFAINQSTLLGWWQSSLQFESCLLGASVKVGPYGSLSLGVSRGC